MPAGGSVRRQNSALGILAVAGLGCLALWTAWPRQQPPLDLLSTAYSNSRRMEFRAGPEGATEVVRGHTVDPGEVRAQPLGGPEAARGRDAVDGVLGVLEQVLRTADSLCAQPLQWCGAGRLAESAGEGAGAHQGLMGEVLDGKRQLEMCSGPVHGRAEVRGAVDGQRLVDVLSLAAFPVGRDDQPPGEGVRDPGPVVLPDDVQAQVQAG